MGRQCIIIAIYSVGICEKTMATLKETVNETHDWSLYRICELCSYGEIENVMNGMHYVKNLMNGLLLITKIQKKKLSP